VVQKFRDDFRVLIMFLQLSVCRADDCIVVCPHLTVKWGWKIFDFEKIRQSIGIMCVCVFCELSLTGRVILAQTVQVSWQSELLLVGPKLLYWARTNRCLVYSVCTRPCMLNIWNINTHILTTTDSEWQTADPTSRQRGHLVMRTGSYSTLRRTEWLAVSRNVTLTT
jgi:hypothetical protein